MNAPTMDTPRMAGLLVVAAVVGLALLRKGFGGVRVSIGN